MNVSKVHVCVKVSSKPHYFHILHDTLVQRCLRLRQAEALLTGTRDCVEVPATMAKSWSIGTCVIIMSPSLSFVSVALPSTCHHVLGDM